jgi:hypothetical protein
MRFGTADLVALQPLHFEGNTFRNNQNHLVIGRGDGSVIVNNRFDGAAPGTRPAGLAVSGENVLVGTNHFDAVGTGVVVLGNDPDFGTTLGIATNLQPNANRFCNVTEAVVIEPLATGTTETDSWSAHSRRPRWPSPRPCCSPGRTTARPTKLSRARSRGALDRWTHCRRSAMVRRALP